MFEPGVTTADIDRAVHDAVTHVGAYPSPLGYGLFPKSCTTSVNNVIARASLIEMLRAGHSWTDGIPDGYADL